MPIVNPHPNIKCLGVLSKTCKKWTLNAYYFYSLADLTNSRHTQQKKKKMASFYFSSSWSKSATNPLSFFGAIAMFCLIDSLGFNSSPSCFNLSHTQRLSSLGGKAAGRSLMVIKVD